MAMYADGDMYGDVCRWGHAWRCMPMRTCMAMYADEDMYAENNADTPSMCR